MGKWLTRPPRLTLAHNCGRRSGQLQIVRAAETFNVSHRPDGKMADMLASTHACTTANDDTSVNYRMCVLLRPSKVPIAPMGKLLTCLPPTHALHNCECFGQLQGVRAAETLKPSHGPDGRIA